MRTALKMGEPARESRQQRVDVYCDVDGVIIPVFDPEVGVDLAKSGWRDWRPQTAKSIDRHGKVRALTKYSPVMANRLRALAALDHVDFWWCTAWGPSVRNLVRVTGLPDAPIIDEDGWFVRNEVITPSSWWKRDAVQAHHAQRPDHAVVWIDDDLGFNEPARLWLRSLGRTALGVTPETSVGLTSREFRRIERFVMH